MKRAPTNKTLDLYAGKRVPDRAYEPFVPGPNPKLPEFIREHSTPYDPAADTYDVPAFERDLVVDKAAPPKAIYDMHTYWSKKHWAAIREYIRHYLPEKYYPRGTGLVLDCFSGSGMTGVAAMMEDRPCVLIDASPAAAFISHCYAHPVPPGQLEAAYHRMLIEPYPDDLKFRLKAATGATIQNLQDELKWLYATRCDRCGGAATTEYVVYSERFQCPRCAEVVALFDCTEERVPYPAGGKKGQKTEFKKRRVCPHCLKSNHGQSHRDFVISTRGKKFGSMPVLVRYHCEGRCKPAADERRHNQSPGSQKRRYFEEHDLGKIATIEKTEIPHWYPRRKMMDVEDDSRPWGLEWRPGRNFRNISDLYTRRSLWALAAWATARERTTLDMQWLDIPLSVSSLTCSRMLTEQKRAITKGTYYLPQVSRAIKFTNALKYSERVVMQVLQALWPLNSRAVLVSNETSTKMSLGRSTLDYVFIDPAYVDNVQYGELNFVWESWLGFDGGWLKDEIVVNPFRDKTIDDWDRDMRAVLGRLYHALKPGRWLSLCYHDTDPGTWVCVQNILLDSGFDIQTVTVLEPKQKSSNQITAEKVVKGDLVVNCLKPRSEQGSRVEADESGLVSERVREILIETLSHAGGQTREHLWDIVLKRLLVRGQMAEHRFDDLLAEVAFRSESGRWFLKEEFESLSQNDLRNEEQAGAALAAFARLRMGGMPASFAAEIVLKKPSLAEGDMDESAIERYIRENLLKGRPEAEKFKLGGRMHGVEFYDFLFFYLTRFLKGRAAGKTPRRNLAEFLDEYLVRFKDGDKWLYRAPDDAEATALRKARRTGLGRRIRQYIAFLNGEGDYSAERRPDVKTLYIWLKHCANFGLPEEGVALFEKGGLAARLGSLSEDDRYDAEDYYTQCKRRASRAVSGEEDEPAGEPEEDSG